MSAAHGRMGANPFDRSPAMPFADELLGAEHAAELLRIAEATLGRRPEALAAAESKLAPLALRERADLLRDALLADAPAGYLALARVVRDAAADPALTGWMIWPVLGAVAQRAVEDGGHDAFDDAMALQAELTGRLTAEFSIRPLLRHDPDRGLAIMLGWTDHPDEHVRRLATEGSRPFLPWGLRVPALVARPEATLPILDALVRDESEYVRRSVANHLNDLSRDHAGLVVATAAGWLERPEATTPALVRHALRTLVKRGDPAALALLGFAPASIEVDGPVLDAASVPMEGSIGFTAELRNTGAEPARLAVDYVVHHRKANGATTTKTFKLTTATLAPGERMRVDRRHAFRTITTRRYHLGEHAIALQVNGVTTEPARFELVAAQ